MRIATRTALAAFTAAFLTLLLTGVAFRARFADVLEDRVDRQLEERAETAPVLAAIADRLSRSELVRTLEPARVSLGGAIVELGELPDELFTWPIEPGWATVTTEGQRWRLYTVEVADVPQVGARSFVQLAEPLGAVDAEARTLRRRVVVVGVLVAVAAGIVGWFLGRWAARPLSALRRDAGRLRDDEPSTWQVADRYGSPEVDDVAITLNSNLRRLADETVRRDRALDAARGFAASASHELRTPLQSALVNLDIAGSDRATDEARAEAIDLARAQTLRMGTSLAAVRALADAESADPTWFEPIDLFDVVEAAVADERRRDVAASVEVVGRRGAPVVAWREGVQLAIANLVRNALVHGRRPGGGAPRIIVTVADACVTVDDDGPGVPSADRTRMLERFVKRADSSGSGLGLAIAGEVAARHGGRVELGDGPLGGARATLVLSAEE